MSERKIVKTTCKGCHGGCGALVTVEDGAIIHVEGDPESVTDGTMCAKGLSQLQHVNNPYRIKYPMKRAAAKGEGKWQRITWDEALDTIASKVNETRAKYGAHTVGISQGTGRGCNRYIHRLARSIGSANTITPGYVCHSPRIGIYGLVTGYGRLYCDYHGWGGEYPKTQIVLAKQLEISSADSEMAYWFIKSLDHAKNLIVIDPRATAMTSRATLWLQLRPGTDAALLLGMMNVIIQEGLYDREFVENWTYGFDELRERAAEYPLEKVEEITWVPKEKIARAARLFAIDTPGCIQVGSSLERQANAGQNIRCVVDLCGITGNIERPGSMMSWVLPPTGLIEDFFNEIPITPEMKAKIRGGGIHKMGAARTAHSDTVIKEILEDHPDRIRVWIAVAGQQLVHLAHTQDVIKAYQKEDCFRVQIDLFMGPAAEYADIVLPAAHYLELDDIYDMHPRFFISAINKAVEPPGEAWPDNKIVLEIGRRVAPEHWPWENVEQMLDYQLRRGNITWKEFSRRMKVSCEGDCQVYYKYKTDYWRKGGGFPTPTGKLELYSTVLKDLGYDPLPRFVEPGESPVSTPELARDYPYVLTTGYRQPFYFLGQYRNIPWLRSFMVYPTAQIHPETAEKHGIKDGDWMWIESPRGRIRQVARVFPGIDPRVVMATANCFYPEEPGPLHGLTISSPNMLTSNEHFDPMYGSPDLTCLMCRISKVEKKDMKDIPRGAYRLQGYEGDIGTVPPGQEGKTYPKKQGFWSRWKEPEEEADKARLAVPTVKPMVKNAYFPFVMLLELAIMAAFIWFLLGLVPTLFPGGYLYYGDAPHVPYLEQYVDTVPMVAARWVLFLGTALFILPMMLTIIFELARWRLNLGRLYRPIPANNPDDEQVTRFDTHLKLQHYLIMIGVTLAGVLGLAQAFPDWSASRTVVDGLSLDTARQFHHYFAYIVDFTIVYFFGYLIYKSFIKKEKLRAMLPTRKDFKDFFEMNLYIFGLRHREPEYARFTFGQKIDFFIIVVGLPVLSLTGLSMHYTDISSQVLGGGGIAMAAVLHRSVAIFVAWFIISVHLYYAHLAPGLFPVNTVILTGKMSKARYRAMYPLDKERLGEAA